MNSIEICIPFIVAILGIAYPVLFQVISNLGEKYDSVLLVSIFKKEYNYKIFKYLLYATLVLILVYILAGITQITNANWLLEQSETLIIIFTLCLIISFFLLVHKILIYYNRSYLTSYFINKDKSRDSESNNLIYFESISELLYWSIKNQNEHIAKTISDYFYECFQNFREISTYSETGYPEQFYAVTYKGTLELLRINDNKLNFLESRIPGGIWLLGEFGDKKIPEKTYSYLWLNLRLCTEYKRDDIILCYWKNAFQYFSYSLRSIEENHSSDYKIVLNEDAIEAREKERERFLEFNYALGGLLLYQRMYDCIHRLFRFTQSEPPSYNLFPSTMREIFDLYFKFTDNYSQEMIWISHKYSFPNTEGMDADGITRHWIQKYFAILFLRQYTLITYYIYQEHVAPPVLPVEQGEKKFWLNHIDYFKDLVLKLRSDKELMIGLRFDLYDNISEEWCKSNGKIPPADLFDETKKSLIQSIEVTEREQEPSAEKINKFKESTKKIISLLFNQYIKITNTHKINDDYRSWYSRGTQALIDKESFADNQGTTHINFDSFLAESYKKELNYTISQQFYLTKTKSYLFDEKALFRSIDYLKIKKPNDYVIIAFDLHLPSFQEIDGLDINNKKYKEIEIHEIKGAFHLSRQSLIIIRKEDLPYFNYLEINPEIREKYKLEEIDSQIKLYASVVDLNKRVDLCKELSGSKEVDLKTQVLLRIELSTEFRWKNDIEVVHIKLSSVYDEKGIPNKLKDVQPFNNK